MRIILSLAFSFFLVTTVNAQSDSAIKKQILDTKFKPRSGDHFLMQFGYTTWNGKPDTIKTGGFPRTVNVYLMMDFPFKTNPKWSAAIGAGIASDNMFFEKMNVGIKENTNTLQFNNVKDTNYFKKYKLATSYLEAPVELRFSSNPNDAKRSIKVAVGLKVGMLLDAHVKGKNLQNRGGTTINDYKMKEYSKQFFNKNRLSATARLGFSSFSVFTSYAITPLIKEGLGPDIRPMTIGLTLSGL
jgi:hypothetical protein